MAQALPDLELDGKPGYWMGEPGVAAWVGTLRPFLNDCTSGLGRAVVERRSAGAPALPLGSCGGSSSSPGPSAPPEWRLEEAERLAGWLAG